jgi:hypothetical protein
VIRRLIALSAALACVFAVAGCSSDKSGTPSGTPSYAQANDLHGAKEFASYWVDTLNQATDSGNTKKLRSLSLKSCTVCTDFADHLDRIYGAGGHVETKGWTVKSVIPVTGLPHGQTAFQVTSAISAQKVYEKKGAPVKKYKGGNEKLQMFLTRKDNHWLVQHLSP